MFNNPILQQLKNQYNKEKKDNPNSNKETVAKENTVKKEQKKSNNFVASNINNKNLNASNLVEGIVKATDKGYGFLETSNRESYFLPPPAMRNLIHGDKILAKITSNGDKQQAQPYELVQPYLTRFLARVKFKNGMLFAVADHHAIKNEFQAKNLVKDRRLKEGDWVIANMTKHAMTNKGVHIVEISEYITYANDPQAPWWVVLRDLDLPKECPSEQKEYIFLENNLPRVDLTNLPFVTIDSEKTKDMDDALHITRNEDESWTLSVAIADPTGYIPENSELDKIAAKRAFSIYLPGRDIPMLPREMSDNLCSLRENEERNSLVAQIHINQDGAVDFEKSKFMLAVIKSQGKLVYDKVSDYLENIETDFKPNDVIAEQIQELRNFAIARGEFRQKHTTIFKDRPEYDFVLNKEGALQEIVITQRRIANKIVEEAMIVANTCAGNLLAQKVNAGIFNAHSGLDSEKINDAIELLKEFNCPITDKEELLSIKGFCAMKRWISESENDYLDARIRKMQAFATISSTPAPHYSLGLDYYATWTSPIRKFGDMINHRLIKSIIADLQSPLIPNSETIESMNDARRKNKVAERGVKDWLYVEYLKPHLLNKTIFNAEIFDISKGGCRAQILENGATVFIPGSNICENRDRINIDPVKGYIYIDNNLTYQITQKVKVQITKIDDINRSIVGQIID